MDEVAGNQGSEGASGSESPETPVVPTGDPNQVLVTIGEISCTQTMVLTPAGSFPLKGTTWSSTNNTRTTTKIPTYAIVLAIVFALLCLIGLLFLLMKEQVTEGFMQVTVQGEGGRFYSTQIPISDPSQVADVERRVNYARGLVSALP